MNLLYFASDRNIGLSSLCTAQAKAIKTYSSSDLVLFCVSSFIEQEHGLFESLEQDGISVFRINGLDNHSNFLNLSKEISIIVRNLNISHLHVQNNWQLALVSYVKYILLKDQNLKTIYTLHGFRHNHFLKSIIARTLIGVSLHFFANRVICMSNFVAKKFRFLSSNLKLIYLGVPSQFFVLDGPNKVEINNGFNIVFPGQFRNGKGQDLLIRAYSKFIHLTGDQESQLFLPGSGELLPGLKSLCDELNVSDRVNFLGQLSRNELIRCYIESNILVVPSNSETFGQTIAEGIVTGKCIISRPVGIAPEIIVDGYNGFIFENEDDLVKIFSRLHSERELISSMGLKVAENRNLFRWENIVHRYYDECF